MGSFKVAPLLLAMVTVTTASASDPHQGEKPEQPSAISNVSAQMPPLEFRPIGNGIVRYDQEGEPVTRLQDMSIRMGKEIANAILAEEKAAKARGEKIPERKKIDLWADREMAVAERRAKYGREVSEHFTIPGTTPEISARIFGPGSRVSKDEDGNTIYETSEEIVTISPTGETRIVPRRVMTITVTNLPKRDDQPVANKELDREQKVNIQQGSLDGVEEGFSAADMNDAAEILLRGGQGIRIDGYFSDVTKDDCSACTKDEKTVGPVSDSRWRNLFSTFFGIQAAYAAEPSIDDIARAGREILQKAQQSDAPLIEKNAHEAWAQAETLELVNEWARAGRLKPKVEAMGGFDHQTDEQLRRIAQEEARNPTARDTYIFISYSLGDKALEDILASAAGKENVELVMRGIPEGSNLVDGLTRIRDIASKFDPVPNIIIDPALFRAYNVKTVPTVVRVSEKRMVRPKPIMIDEVRDELNFTKEDRAKDDLRGQIHHREADPSYQGRTVPMMLAKVEGLNNARWLNEQIELGHVGDFGNRGFIYPIDEPDLIEVMQKRALGIDWEAKKKAAFDNFWTSQARRFFPMTTAVRSCHRTMDPTFEVAKNIHDADGHLIRRAGERINPLDQRSFDAAVVIFNPKNRDEIDIVKQLKKRFLETKNVHQVIWIATEMDTERGWDAYTEITEMLDAPLFMLTPEIMDRWAISVTPSVITANNEQKHFIVEEIAPGDVSATEVCHEHP